MSVMIELWETNIKEHAKTVEKFGTHLLKERRNSILTNQVKIVAMKIRIKLVSAALVAITVPRHNTDTICNTGGTLSTSFDNAQIVFQRTSKKK